MDDLSFAFVDRGNHLVEAFGQPANLVVGDDIEADFAAFADRAGRLVELFERFGHRARDPPAHRQHQCDPRRRERAEQQLEVAKCGQALCQRMAQHQPRADPLLQNGQIRDVDQRALAAKLALEHGVRARGAQPALLPRIFDHLRLKRDRGEFDQPVKLGAVEGLGDHQPADQVGRFDRGGSRQCKTAARTDDPAGLARVELGPERVRRRDPRSIGGQHLAFEREDECHVAARAVLEAGERARNGGRIARRDRLAKAEIVGEDACLVAHLARACGEDLVEHARIGGHVARRAVFAEIGERTCGKHHHHAQHRGKQRGKQQRDARPQRSDPQVRQPRQQRAWKCRAHRNATASLWFCAPPVIVIADRFSPVGVRSIGCHTVRLALPPAIPVSVT